MTSPGNATTFDWAKYVVPGGPPVAAYVPEFINERQEKALLHELYNVPRPKWTQLSNRRLQNWGGVPSYRGMLAEPVPPWLSVYCDLVSDLGVFDSSVRTLAEQEKAGSVDNDPKEETVRKKISAAFGNHGTFTAKARRRANHVLVNEYEPGQGIMPHTDGPIYHPTVATINLGSHTLLDFYRPVPDKESARKEASGRKGESGPKGTSGPKGASIPKGASCPKGASTSNRKPDGNKVGEPVDESEMGSLSERYVMSLLLEPRSLNIIQESLYTDYLHGISEVTRDDLSGKNVVNLAQCTSPLATTSGVIERGTRVSLTIRHVARTCDSLMKFQKHLFK